VLAIPTLPEGGPQLG